MAESRCEEVFDELVVDDIEFLYQVGEACVPIIHEILHIKLGSPKVPIAMYITAFDCITDFLRSMQATEEMFEITLANRLIIGYTTTFDDPSIEDMEKVGNFMVYMKHLENHSETDIDRDERNSVVRCTQWNEANNISSMEFVGNITKRVVDAWDKKLDIKSANPEIVMPVFCIIHEKLVEMTVLKRQLSGEFQERINVGGCYELFVQMMEDGIVVSFKPTVYDKITLKDDKNASSRYE